MLTVSCNVKLSRVMTPCISDVGVPGGCMHVSVCMYQGGYVPHWQSTREFITHSVNLFILPRLIQARPFSIFEEFLAPGG